MINPVFTGTVRANAISIPEPTEQTVNWNPEEYRVEYIDLVKGEIKFIRLDVKTNE